MKIVFGTGNLAKLSAMRNRLKSLNLEIIGLQDMRKEGRIIPEVEENGKTPLENARIKALAYYQALGVPVFSCDSGLYFENVEDHIQPGVHVRTIQGRYLSDEEMLEYYTGLVKSHGPLTARYKNALCFVKDSEHIYEAMDESLASKRFILTGTPHSAIRKPGFPLDSISLEYNTGKYFYDLEEDRIDQFAVEDGVLQHFRDWL